VEDIVATSKDTTDGKVVLDSIRMPARGGPIDALLCRPAADGIFPGIVMGAEGTGINRFITEVGRKLAHLGYVTIVPDYYRGAGPPDPDDVSDVPLLIRYIDGIDFRLASQDMQSGFDYLLGLPYVDGSRIGTWGYCTGGTLAMMAACLNRELAASVWFFPSQPVFERIDAGRPVHPMDLVWNIHCPVLVFYGDNDIVMSAELLAELERRFLQWDIDYTLKVYPGAEHAFTGDYAYNEEADKDSWSMATQFADRHLKGN
jgi:carboxymethylenebutenolidase